MTINNEYLIKNVATAISVSSGDSLEMVAKAALESVAKHYDQQEKIFRLKGEYEGEKNGYSSAHRYFVTASMYKHMAAELRGSP